MGPSADSKRTDVTFIYAHARLHEEKVLTNRNRYLIDCRYRVRKFKSQLGDVTFLETDHFYGHSPPLADSRRLVCQLLAKECAQVLVHSLEDLGCPGKV